MPPQRHGQRLGRTGRIAKPAAGCRQPQPGLPQIDFGADRTEQRCRTHVVMAETSGRERQRHRPVAWRKPMRAVEPAARLRPVLRGGLGLTALERLECQRRVFFELGQRPTA
jgi:hypothetical protein